MFWEDLTRRAFRKTTPAQPPPTPHHTFPLRLGLALGGGAARGWAHIGVLQVLTENNIKPDIIVGTSIGAVVGGCYAAGKLDALEHFVRALTRSKVMGLLDFRLAGAGLIAGERLRRLLERDLSDTRIENLNPRFAAIATELKTGHEIWLTRGPIVEAMRASYALPGIFNPVRVAGRWLMDGALVNPIPITTARAMGAEMVICVNLNGEAKLRGTIIQAHGEEKNTNEINAGIIQDETVRDASAALNPQPKKRHFFDPVREAAGKVLSREPKITDGPRMASVMIDAFNITQDRIARSRLAGDPPDLIITPKLAGISLFEFHKGAEAIELGRQAALRALPDLREMIQDMPHLSAHKAEAAEEPVIPSNPAG
jgi:NTE family protein